jgi:RNA ligase (TIGR02306 family)
VAGVRALLEELAAKHRQVVLFGEVYGKVQSLRYGVDAGIRFAAFDLLIDGKYADYDVFVETCARHGVATTPPLFHGAFSLETIRALAEGRTAMPGADHIREGVVVRPVRERLDPKIGRVILKYVGDGYLLGNESDTDDV